MNISKSFSALHLKCLKLGAKIGLSIHDTAMLPAKVHAAVFVLSLAVTGHAQAAGITGFFTGFTGAINAAILLILQAAQLMGVAAVLYGLYNLAKKGMNRGEDVEWSKVLYPILGGALLTIIFYVIQSVVEEGGASKSDIGRVR